MSLSKTFCPAPFTHIQVSKRGEFGPCCFTSNSFNKEDSNIHEKWNSEQINNLRNNLLRGKKDKTCSRCWQEEDAGKQSLRQRMLFTKNSKNLQKQVFQRYVEREDYKKYPRVVQLMPGNECNLACPSCKPELSSKWNSLVKQKDYSIFQRTTKNWNLTKEQYQDIVDNSDKLQKIELFGGEPFLNKRNEINLLQKLIDKGTSKHITLYFNTNGTIYNEKLIEKLSKNFKFLEIRLSMDGIGDQFEYLRYGAKWEQVIANAERFIQIPNSDFEAIMTVSTFNVLELPTYDDFFTQKNWSAFYNIANYPSHIEIYNIPEHIKKQITLPKKFQDVIEYMNNTKCNMNEWYRFLKYTKILEKNRDMPFQKYFPKFFGLINNNKYGHAEI